ncbi:MAG: hypothetical protein IKO10_15470 [Lachnospiraceae bacterium]|nr:hypothetical protein [Lachnospiraceae bacterium]
MTIAKRKRTLAELLAESGETEYPKQYEYIASLLQSGKVIPVKSAPLNGRRPALCTAYWEIAEELADEDKLKEELLFRISPKINTDYYLHHLSTYQKEREQALKLNRFFVEETDAVKDTVSLNERSFQIWGREKFLQREQGNKLLAHCGLKPEDLNIYRTTEPLAYYSVDRSTPQGILILENKDTFYTMRRFLMEGGRFIFSAEIKSVIYGAGKGVLRSFEDFFFCMEEYMRHPQNRILYFGDLDYEGIRIYEQLAASFGTQCGIRPHRQAYLKMLEIAGQKGGDFLPDCETQQNKNIEGSFWETFSAEEIRQMQTVLETGKYIPQEIINISDLRRDPCNMIS